MPALAQETAGPDPDVIDVLLQACERLQADEVERMALFQAAIVASNLRADFCEDDRLGVLGQNPFWGPPPARRDPRTAAERFLSEARRRRDPGDNTPSAARLAVQVQGGGSVWRHKSAGKTAKRLILDGGGASTVEAVA